MWKNSRLSFVSILLMASFLCLNFQWTPISHSKRKQKKEPEKIEKLEAEKFRGIDWKPMWMAFHQRRSGRYYVDTSSIDDDTFGENNQITFWMKTDASGFIPVSTQIQLTLDCKEKTIATRRAMLFHRNSKVPVSDNYNPKYPDWRPLKKYSFEPAIEKILCPVGPKENFKKN